MFNRDLCMMITSIELYALCQFRLFWPTVKFTVTSNWRLYLASCALMEFKLCVVVMFMDKKTQKYHVHNFGTYIVDVGLDLAENLMVVFSQMLLNDFFESMHDNNFHFWMQVNRVCLLFLLLLVSNQLRFHCIDIPADHVTCVWYSFVFFHCFLGWMVSS